MNTNGLNIYCTPTARCTLQLSKGSTFCLLFGLIPCRVIVSRWWVVNPRRVPKTICWWRYIRSWCKFLFNDRSWCSYRPSQRNSYTTGNQCTMDQHSFVISTLVSYINCSIISSVTYIILTNFSSTVALQYTV